MRRLFLLALLLTLALDTAAYAAAGGGSSSFDGGGSGGGEIGMLIRLVLLIASLPWQLVVAIVVLLFLLFLLGSYVTHRENERRAERQRQVELAAVVAADDDPAFAADAVRAEAVTLFRAVQRAWTERDLATLATLASRDLLVEWKRRLDDFARKGWHNRVQLRGEPHVEYLGLVNREDDAEDRVVVRITCELLDYVITASGERLTRDDETSESVTCVEFWTLYKRDGRWRLASIEQDAEGKHHLDRPIVATPWYDDQRLREDAVAERAAADALPAGVAVAEVADLDFEGAARTAALDLALADGRFDPDLIEASVRRAVDAWAHAVDGDDADLEATASPAAITDLLHPGDPGRTTRLVVRGPRVDGVRIADLDARTEPATIAVELDVAGRRYLEDRDTVALIAGSRDREQRWTERWTLALDGAAPWPWRIVAAR